MAIVNVTGISGINSITAQSTSLNFYTAAGNNLPISAGTLNVGTGTSISSPATNVLTLGTNDVERVRVNSSGNIGVGTNGPVATVDVVTNSTTEGLRVRGRTSDNIGSIYFYNNSATTSQGYIQARTAELRIDTDSSNPLTFYTGGSERVRVSAGGSLGVRESSPDLPLHVSGDNAYPASSGSVPRGFVSVRAKSAGATHGLHIGIANVAPYGSWLQAQDANNLATNYPLLLNPNGGYVGVGTINPGFQLTVDQGTSDGNLVDFKNEEVRLVTGVWGTGSTYPREITLNATRADSGTVPFLRLAGQGGIAFAVDLNTIQGTITSNGEFRIGTANQTAVSSDRVHVMGEVSIATVQTNLARLIMQERTSNWISFKDGSGTHYGTISRNGAGITYGSNSDYRLKENVTSLSRAIEKVKALKPVTFNFIDRPETIVDGFLAHEVQEVAPYAVTGEKDGYDVSGDVLDSDGEVVKQFIPEPEELEEGQTWVETSRDVKIQQLDPAKLVPVLTAALQEALAKIETLEARLDAAGL